MTTRDLLALTLITLAILLTAGVILYGAYH